MNTCWTCWQPCRLCFARAHGNEDKSLFGIAFSGMAGNRKGRLPIKGSTAKIQHDPIIICIISVTHYWVKIRSKIKPDSLCDHPVFISCFSRVYTVCCWPKKGLNLYPYIWYMPHGADPDGVVNYFNKSRIFVISIMDGLLSLHQRICHIVDSVKNSCQRIYPKTPKP